MSESKGDSSVRDVEAEVDGCDINGNVFLFHIQTALMIYQQDFPSESYLDSPVLRLFLVLGRADNMAILHRSPVLRSYLRDPSFVIESIAPRNGHDSFAIFMVKSNSAF